MTHASRQLIVNADDFGLSRAANRGIVQAHERGIVTSASLMVRWPGAEEAAAYGSECDAFSLGLHIDLGEWTFSEGEWRRLYEVLPEMTPEAVACEVNAQLETFRRLTRRNPTHLDSHQHVHCEEPTRAVVLELGRALGVPVRHLSPTVRYCGDFYGQTAEGYPLPEYISSAALIRTLERLPEGVTELACHPSAAPEENTMYSRERVQELRALCDPLVRKTLTDLDVELCTFVEVAP